MRLIRRSSLFSLPADSGIDRIIIEINVRMYNLRVLGLFIVLYCNNEVYFPQGRTQLKEIYIKSIFPCKYISGFAKF